MCHLSVLLEVTLFIQFQDIVTKSLSLYVTVLRKYNKNMDKNILKITFLRTRYVIIVLKCDYYNFG